MLNKPLNSLPGCLYEIRVQGCLTVDWSDWLGGLTIEVEGNHTTVLRGHLPDQSALLGVLNQIHSLNLTLVSVLRCAEKV